MKNINTTVKIIQIFQAWMKQTMPTFRAWIKRKAKSRSGVGRINNTSNEHRRLQHSILPRVSAEWPALLVSRLTRRKVLARGDTIIEVMISLVVLSMVLVTVYAMGSRSLRTGTEANQRTEALTTAQSQVDLLINAKNVDPNFAANYQVAQAFCLNPDGTKNTSAQSNANKLCNSYNGSQYNVGVSYSSNLFTVTTQWPSPDAPNGTANLNLYYKLPGTYRKALVTAGSASVAGTTATVNGTVNPNGNIVTDCYFNYDITTSYTGPKRVSCLAFPGSGNSAVEVSAVITSLDPNTIYFFRLCATNLVGTACSDNNGTFTTPARPTISNQSATNTASISGNNADLNGQVNPNGTNVSDCHFEWGTNMAYGSSKNCGGVVGSGTTPVPVTVNIAPFVTAGITYHFRLVATNAAGTTAGPDATFVPTKLTPPQITNFKTDNNPIAYGASTILRWASTDTTSCTGTGFNTSNQISGSVTTGNLIVSTAYSLTCTGPGGTVGPQNYTVTVNPPPTVTISASPTNVGNGGSSNLTWVVSGVATSCTASGNWSGGKASSVGSHSEGTGGLGGPATYTFYINCSGPGGNSPTVSASVTANAPPPCGDHSHNPSGGPAGWSFSIGGSNPCGVGISQCNVFNSGGGSLGQFTYGNANPATGSYNPPGAAYVGCMDIQGHWF